MATMSQVPSLGSRGEGYVLLQFLLLAGVGAGALLYPDTAGLPGGTARTAIGLALILGAGVVGLAGGLALRSSASLTALPHPTADANLVMSGPYAHIRHPIYAALILFSLGLSVVQDSAPALGAVLGLAVLLDLKRRREEARLLGRFAEYADYRRRTKAFVPLVY
jgi:protein-S-isoprenylcysteine O-methyltransferase Ste14